jgi:hypothetical protein
MGRLMSLVSSKPSKAAIADRKAKKERDMPSVKLVIGAKFGRTGPLVPGSSA